MFPIHVCIESFTIYILTKSNSFKFQLLQNWFSGIVARLDRFHEKLLRHAIFKWGPVTEKFSNWEFSFFSFLISTVEVTFVQIWANSALKNPTWKGYFVWIIITIYSLEVNQSFRKLCMEVISMSHCEYATEKSYLK